MEKTFEEWYDAFCEFVRGSGYNGFIDQDSIIADYEEGLDAMYAAEAFVKKVKDL